MLNALLALSLALALTPLAGAEPLGLCPAAQNRGGMSMIASDDGYLFAQWELKSQLELQPSTRRGLQRLGQAFEGEDMSLVVLLLPTRPMATPGSLPPELYPRERAVASYRLLRDQLQAIDGITVVDGLAVALGAEEFYFRTDHHWTPEGSKVAAAVVAATIGLSPRWEGVSTEPWTTVVGESAEQPGNLTDRVLKSCPLVVHPPIRFPSYTTAPESGGPGLFDELPVEPVVALGSSFMAPEWHFSGFLEEQLGADVLPVTLGGGHALGAMLSWVRSADFERGRPRVVVWELEVNDLVRERNDEVVPSVDKPVAWSQVEAGVRGSCLGHATARVEGAAAHEMSLFSLDASSSSGDHYLVLEASDPALQELVVVSRWSNGRQQKVKLPAYRKVPATGRFFLMLRTRGAATLTHVDLIVPEDHAVGEVSAWLCPVPQSSP